MVAGEPPQLGPHRTADRALQPAAVRPRPCWCGRKARPRPGPGMGLGTKPPTWPVRALQPRRARATRSDQRPEASNKKTDGPITSRRPRPQGNVFSVCIVRMRRSAENTRIFSVLESAGERMVHHCPQLSAQVGPRKWGTRPPCAVACTHGPSLETPHPTPVGALWSTQPERARPCMRARMAHARQCAAAARRKRGGPRFRQASQRLQAVRHLQQERSSRTGTKTVRNGLGRHWGGWHTPRDRGIIAEQMPGPERG